MNKIGLFKKILLLVSLLMIITQSTSVFAQGGGPGGRHGGPRGNPYGPGDYYWRDGHWWVGDVIAAITLGTIIATLPPRYEAVYVGGVTYYYDGVYYYQRYPTGYVVVANPTPVVVPATTVVVPASTVSTQGVTTIIINVPNKDGTFTPVTLIKHKDGYLGPQGEYYQDHPTVEQLKVLYGK